MRGPAFRSGLGGYGPWPTGEILDHDTDPSPFYKDGYDNCAPGGHMEAPDDLWIDRIVYPRRNQNPEVRAMMDHARAEMLHAADEQDMAYYMRSRSFRISQGNVTGRDPGPSED